MQVLIIVVAAIILAPIALAILAWMCGIRYIPHNKVGVIEKLWSPSGSLGEGRIIARQGEAGLIRELCRVHPVPLPLALGRSAAPSGAGREDGLNNNTQRE
jgi:hypothetical protein